MKTSAFDQTLQNSPSLSHLPPPILSHFPLSPLLPSSLSLYLCSYAITYLLHSVSSIYTCMAFFITRNEITTSRAEGVKDWVQMVREGGERMRIR